MTETPNSTWLDLLSVIAHDLKTPITAVKGCIELVQNLGTLNQRQQHFSERALIGLQRMEQLVMMLLDVAWLDADKPLDLHPVDVGALVRDTAALVESIAAARSIVINVSIASDTGTVLGDARRLSQVINNLIGNAIKYNRDEGRVWIEVKGDDDTLTVRVEDTGIGIPADEVPRLFERFFRSSLSTEAKIEGTGLGLAIARGVIERHQGRIWVESVPGVGSTFTFVLPRTPREVEGGSIEDFGHALRETPEVYPHDNIDFPSERDDGVEDNLQESDERQPLDRDVGEV